MKSYLVEVLLGTALAIGLILFANNSIIESTYCSLLEFNPIVCYDDFTVRSNIFFSFFAVIGVIASFKIKEINASFISAVVLSATFCLIIITAVHFVSVSEISLLQWLFIVPLQISSGIFVGFSVGMVVLQLWINFGATSVLAIRQWASTVNAGGVFRDGSISTTVHDGAVGVAGSKQVFIGTQNVGGEEPARPLRLTVENVSFDPNGPTEIYVEFYLANPGRPTIVHNWRLRAINPQGVEFYGLPRLIFTKATQERLDIGGNYSTQEDLSVTPLEEGGARHGRATYSHTSTSEPFRQTGTIFRLVAEDVRGKAVISEFRISIV